MMLLITMMIGFGVYEICTAKFCELDLCYLDSPKKLMYHFHFSLSCTGEGNGNPIQCSCLENPRDRGTWWAAIYGVAQS